MGGAHNDGNHYTDIKYTNDSGENWNTQYSELYQHFYIIDMFFINDTTGWAVGEMSNEPYALKTNNGGIDWDIQLVEGINETTVINCVFFLNDTIGWIGVGNIQTSNHYGAIYFTNDGGINWQLQQEFYKAILDIQMLNKDTGWAVGGDYIYYSNNADTIIIVDIEENIQKKDIVKISPNPFTDNIKIQISNKYQLTEIIITDITGKIYVQKNTITNNQLNLNFLPQGIYFITLKLNNLIIQTQKIIKL